MKTTSQLREAIKAAGHVRESDQFQEPAHAREAEDAQTPASTEYAARGRHAAPHPDIEPSFEREAEEHAPSEADVIPDADEAADAAWEEEDARFAGVARGRHAAPEADAVAQRDEAQATEGALMPEDAHESEDVLISESALEPEGAFLREDALAPEDVPASEIGLVQEEAMAAEDAQIAAGAQSPTDVLQPEDAQPSINVQQPEDAQPLIDAQSPEEFHVADFEQVPVQPPLAGGGPATEEVPLADTGWATERIPPADTGWATERIPLSESAPMAEHPFLVHDARTQEASWAAGATDQAAPGSAAGATDQAAPGSAAGATDQAAPDPVAYTAPEARGTAPEEHDIARYRRREYGSASRKRAPSLGYGAHGVLQQERPKGKRIAIAVAAVIIALFLIAAIAAISYIHRLDEVISIGGEQRAGMAELLEGHTATEPYYTLIIGSDTRDEAQYEVGANEMLENERADVIILARIDEPNKKVTLLSIPRDTPWVNESGQIVKLNESFANRGPAGIIGAVEQVSGVNVAHYVQVRFSGFKDLVDALGGITVDVPVAVSRKDALTKEFIELQPGVQTLDGKQALIFARARHEYSGDQDSARQGSQRTIIKAIVDKIRELPVTELPQAILAVAACVGTDMSALDVLDLGMDLRGDMTLYDAGAPHEGDVNEAAGGIWLCYDDKEGWQKVMSVIESGEDPSKVSYVGDVAYIAGTDETVVIE